MGAVSFYLETSALIALVKPEPLSDRADRFARQRLQRVEMTPGDLAAATVFLRRLDLPLRTPDALHIAIAQRVGAMLVTFDRQMAASARTLGSAVQVP